MTTSAPQYDFDRIIERRHTHSLKWDDMQTHFGKSELLPLWVADMDFETAPEIIEALQERTAHGIFGYVHTPSSLNQLAADWTMCHYGHQMDPSQLAFSPGVVPSLAVLVRDFTAPEDKILIQPPVYGPFGASVKNYGRTLVTSRLKEEDGNYTMDFDDFEAKASDPQVKWFILCNPHNPVGRVWKKAELQRLSDICLKHQVRVISDEIWRDLVFEGHRHIPFAGLSKEVEAITITLFSVTKTFNLAGIQASFAHFPRAEELEKFKGAFALLDITRHSPFNLVAMEAALTKGEPWLKCLRAYLDGNMSYVETYVKENLPGVRFVKPEATYLAWLDFRGLGFGQKELMALLQEKGNLALNDGFWFGKEGIGFARMNVACPRSTVEQAMLGIKKALSSL